MWTLSVLKIFLNNPSVEQAVKTEAIFVQQRDLVKIGMVLIIRMILLLYYYLLCHCLPKCLVHSIIFLFQFLLKDNSSKNMGQ